YEARTHGFDTYPHWPMIVLATPKGWTCPKEINGKQTEGSWRAHQVPIGDFKKHPEHIGILEKWMRSYRPEELFDGDGKLKPEIAALAPLGKRRMGNNPHSNGGVLLKELRMPDYRQFAVNVTSPC